MRTLVGLAGKPAPTVKQGISMYNFRVCNSPCDPRPYQLRRYDYICDSCEKSRQARARVRMKDRGYVRPYDKEWRRRNNYYNRPEVKRREKERIVRDIVKYKARWAVAAEIRYRGLRRQPCAACGASNTHAHHADYLKPLKVRWLCVKCHRVEHARTRRGLGV